MFNWFLGTTSSAIEAVLPVPQLALILKNKHTAGVSSKMILMWLAGDAFKVYYYFVNNSPWQLTLGGFFAIGIDCCILSTFIIFKSATDKELKAQKEIEHAKKTN